MPAGGATGPYVLCSTPFGITEVGMLSLPGGAAALTRVLNAFRHHRGGHAATRAVATV